MENAQKCVVTNNKVVSSFQKSSVDKWRHKELCVKITLDFYFIDVLRRLIWQLDQLVSEDCAGLAKEVYEISKCCAQPHVGLMVGLHFRWFLLLP